MVQKDQDNFEARKHAVISACQKEKIKYSYDDPNMEIYFEQYSEVSRGAYADFVEFLISQKDLRIKRTSFLEWINSLKEDIHLGTDQN